MAHVFLKKALLHLTSTLSSAARISLRSGQGTTALQTKRICGVYSWYARLHGSKELIRNITLAALRVLEKARSIRLLRSYLRKLFKPSGVLLSAVAFSWDNSEITNEEVAEVCEEIFNPDESLEYNAPLSKRHAWDTLTKDRGLTLLRRPAHFDRDSPVYEYKVYGAFTDITAQSFIDAQVDVDCRKQWDLHSGDIEVIDKDDETGCELIRWIVNFPRPMSNREYVYVRRLMKLGNRIVLMSRTTDVALPASFAHTASSSLVRVERYRSLLVVEPFTSKDQNGFKYVLVYYDDPKAQLPSVIYNYGASKGVIDFLNRLHDAALKLQTPSAGHKPTVPATGEDWHWPYQQQSTKAVQ